MPSLAPDKIDFPPPGRRGVVSKAPAALGDPFEVTIESFDRRYVFEVELYSAQGDAVPAVGDEVLVVEDEQGEPWVPVWWPAGGLGPGGGGGPAGSVGFVAIAKWGVD